MGRKASGTTMGKLRGMGGRTKTTRSAKEMEKILDRMPPIYAMDDLPESVLAALRVLYPKSKDF